MFETEPINMIFGRAAYGRGWRLDWLDLPGKVMASVVAMLIAGGACALCVAVAVKALRGLFGGKESTK